MKKEYSKAIYEVYIVLQYTDEEVKCKIPKKFMKFMKENMDRTHKFYLKENVCLEKQNLMYETKQIIALIYRDFICSKEEREKLIAKEKRNKIEQKNEEKYNINFKKNVNNKKYSIEKINNTKEKSLIKVEKEKWYKKLIEKMFKILKIKN